MTEQMKPCPFCGGKTIDYENPLFAICADCLAENWTDNWNTRPLEDALQVKIDDLLEACEIALKYIDENGVSTHKCDVEVMEILRSAIAKARGKK